ncbi:MAG: hypothetical protein ACK5F7_10355 [Planctomycetaceae bacterium]|jgi:hypothetical protein
MIEPVKKDGPLSARIEAAFRRVAEKVVERARQSGTPVVVWKDDRVTELVAEQIADNRTLKTGTTKDEGGHG